MIGRVLRVRAHEAAGFARTVHAQDPAWRSETFPLAGGQVALWGAGLYVNGALGSGHERLIAAEEFDHLEARSAAVGVDPAIEISPLTLPEVRRAVADRGYVHVGSVSVQRRRLDDAGDLPVDPSVLVEAAAGELADWQHTSALAWGHVTAEARRASDAFAAAAATLDGDGFVLARDAVDRRAIGCASVSITSGVATLGAASTLPDARRRGVQSALIHHRLRFARARGGDVAVTTASPGGASERNLRRHGFESWFEIETWVRRTTRSLASSQ